MALVSFTTNFGLSTSIKSGGGNTLGSGAKALSVNATSVLQQIGKDPTALNTTTMTRLKLESAFKDFNSQDISPAQLGLVSKNLADLGLIDQTTANLFISAGTDLDKVGNQKNPDVKINAMEFFAARITSLRTAKSSGNYYAEHVIPDYKKAMYVLQNLDAFAKQGQAAAKHGKA